MLMSKHFSSSGFYDYDLDLRIGTPILNFSEIFFRVTRLRL
jgi:hypothetical protein